MIDYSKFQKALEHLEAQFKNYKTNTESFSTLIQEAIAESVIQRFEVCYDCLWKVLKRHLIEKLGMPNVPNSPKGVFRVAHENELIPLPVEKWLLYADIRTGTAHDYSGKKAQECLESMGEFIQDAKTLYGTLTQYTT